MKIGSHLLKGGKKLDVVVISGGELNCHQVYLISMHKVKSMGHLVNLDTMLKAEGTSRCAERKPS